MTHAVFVDRIEGALAVLLTPDGASFALPQSLLPAGVGEGRWLRLRLDPDPGRDASAKVEVAALRARLTGGDDGGDLAL